MKKFIFALTIFLSFSATAALAGDKYTVMVDGMTCPFCVNKTEKSLKSLSGVNSVSTNLKAGIISVCAAPSAEITSAKVKSLITSAGFTFKSLSKKGSC